MRGTPQQIIEKYLALARDAQLSNDRVAEQAFFQHAEHYTRLLGEALREQAERQQHQQNNQNHQQPYGRSDDQQPRGGDDGRDYNAPRDESGQHRAEVAQDRRGQYDAQPDIQSAGDAQPDEQPGTEAATDHAAAPVRNQRAPRRPAPALPDALGTDAEEGEVRVDTPEEKSATRRPRAPRSANPAPRARRKPAEDAPAAVDSAEQG